MDSVLQFLKEKSVLVTGATGFLAKLFVEKILRIQPNVKRVYLLIRAEDTRSAQKRLLNEVVEKELFKVVRDTWGDHFESFIMEKLIAVPGDVSYDENLGIRDSSLREEMSREIDLLVNSAATTSFDGRYDVGFDTNTMGAFHVLTFGKRCVKMKMLLHVSTAYVCGERSGLIPENQFKYGETLRGTCKLDIKAEKELIQQILHELQAEGASEAAVTSTMKDLGIKRARLYGWPNTYVFTKAMGEMLLGYYSQENLPITIIRPTMITSTYKEPFPGWIEGLRTIDGVIVGYGKGKIKCLLANPDTIMDLIPGDMVVNSMIIALMSNANNPSSSQMIYHVGSSLRNPMTLLNLNEIFTIYFTKNPYITRNGKPVKVGKIKLVKSMPRFRRYMSIKYGLPLKGLKLMNSVFCRRFEDILKENNRKFNFVMRLVELYQPYMLFKGIFDDTNSEKLGMATREKGEEVDAFNFDPVCIDWKDYIINTHIPGLNRYVVIKR